MFILWMLSRNCNFSRFEVRIGGQLNDDRKNLKDSSTLLYGSNVLQRWLRLLFASSFKL